MSEQKEPVSDSSASSGGSDAADLDVKEQTKDAVSYETYKRVLSQLKNTQAKLKEKEESELQKQEMLLQEKGQWKDLVALKDQELSQTRQKLIEKEQAESHLKETLFNAAKLQAVRDRLPGKLERDEYMAFIKVDKVVLNPETNEIDPTSVDLVVQDFVKNHAKLLSQQTVTLPNGMPKPATQLSYEEWVKLPSKDKRARLKDVVGSPVRK